MATSKTNPQAGTRTPGFRTSINRIRILDGKEVKPIWYCGKWEGHGSYMAGHIDGITVMDAHGKPLPFRSIGNLEP
ncbi:hypothetical protein EBR43_11555 [bacterium]|nr:hypothetical protein [bacterium]